MAVGVCLLVGLSVGAVLFATTRAVTHRSLGRASEDLEVARSKFYRLLDSRAESAAALTRLVAELPVFRAHLTDKRLAADGHTIDEMADRYRRQLSAQFCVVTDARGAWISKPGWPATEQPPAALRSSIEAALAGRSERDIVAVHDRLFLVVAEPVRFAEEILGTMAVAYALDDVVAEELAQATHRQVSLVSGKLLSASSLRGAERAELARLLAGSDDVAAHLGVSTGIRRLGTERYVERTFPLSGSRALESPDRLVLLHVDWRPTQQFLNALQWQFLGAGALIFVFALAGGLVFSRRMSQPLREIASAAGEIAAGNWSREVPVGGSAEATTMAVAFNEMSTSLRGAQDRMLHDAFHDPLTQLPNRALFMDRLQRAITRRARHPEFILAVIFVDLDRFKRVNDSIGHPAGDRLLLEIASRLTATLRQYDTVSRPAAAARPDCGDSTVARVGGDEFTILLEDIRDPSDAVRVAERIQEALAVPVSLGGQEVYRSVSIGIAVSTSAHCSGEDLVRDSDIAMCRAKASGGDRCALFDATMHHRAVERLELETELRHASERHEFRLQYQPIVSLADHRVIGFEALLRWQHPEQGFLLPAAFLKVAEETRLITRIDHWVLGEACAEARRWQKGFPSDSPASVSVNISAQGFGQPDIVRQVATTLQKTGLDPHSLRLEITEGVAMADAERTRTILTDLKALGVRISLDDFGTGYSSLSYLQRFPVDTLKIDRSFVAGIDEHRECREIIRTILNLARTLGLDVIAEGTETATQVDYLERLDCRFGQGYFFARPAALEELRLISPSSAAETDRAGV